MNRNQLTAGQVTTIKNHINANTNTVVVGGVSTQIKDVPRDVDHYQEVTAWYNDVANPVFWTWRSTISRAEVYHKVGPEGTVFVWDTFRTQSATDQNTWTQMFMGDQAPCCLLTFRQGVFSVFSGSAAQNTQRAHVLSMFRRNAIRIETLIAAAVTPVGTGGNTISPVANNGNTLGDALGGTTNPALLPFTPAGAYVEGAISVSDLVSVANN